MTLSFPNEPADYRRGRACLLDFTPGVRPRWDEQLEYSCCHSSTKEASS
jgi:hypothetical protein